MALLIGHISLLGTDSGGAGVPAAAAAAAGAVHVPAAAASASAAAGSSAILRLVRASASLLASAVGAASLLACTASSKLCRGTPPRLLYCKARCSRVWLPPEGEVSQ